MIIKAISPIASIKAKQIKEDINSCPLSEGFLEIPSMNAPNKIPRPHPGPIREIVAKPAPINLYPNVILGGSCKIEHVDTY